MNPATAAKTPQEPSPSSEELLTQKALLERPSFSIRFRITSAFALAMLFSFGIGVVSIAAVSRMDSKQRFFEQAENFLSEIEEARRYEKNFFLYGSKNDLYDAQSHAHAAAGILDRAVEIRSVLKPEAYAALTGGLEEYGRLLGELAAEDAGGQTDSASPRDPKVERQLRYFGHRILTYAGDMVKQERVKMHTTAASLHHLAIGVLAVNLIVMIWVASELTRQILRPVGRAVEYARRIASGDFSLITPKKKYRDEFSDLAIAINRMILELRRNQEQLLQSRKMAAVGTLTAGIAHELNNPLNNISLTAEALLEMRDQYAPDQIREMLTDILTQTERASATVRNLLDFTRVDRTRLESVCVADLIESSLRLVGNELSLQNISTEVDLADELPPVRGRFRNLEQVFLNLFLNAVQAMSDGGQLTVRARVDGKEFVRVDVADTGCGIPEEHLDQIFDPFFTTKEVGQGTGLGLSVSYGILEKVGGRLEVKSELNKGTVFSVFLPIREESAGNP